MCYYALAKRLRVASSNSLLWSFFIFGPICIFSDDDESHSDDFFVSSTVFPLSTNDFVVGVGLNFVGSLLFELPIFYGRSGSWRIGVGPFSAARVYWDNLFSPAM